MIGEDHASIADLEESLLADKERLYAALRERPNESVEDYQLTRSSGEPVRLSDLFDDRGELVLVHNMGTSCPYCTMWADGFNGLVDHLEDRAAFVVCSPDPPAEQSRFIAERGWEFDMVSAHGTEFVADLGYREAGAYRPGVSTFHKGEDGTIELIAQRRFGPFDDYCSAWNLFGLLEGGVGGWTPRFEY